MGVPVGAVAVVVVEVVVGQVDVDDTGEAEEGRITDDAVVGWVDVVDDAWNGETSSSVDTSSCVKETEK